MLKDNFWYLVIHLESSLKVSSFKKNTHLRVYVVHTCTPVCVHDRIFFFTNIQKALVGRLSFAVDWFVYTVHHTGLVVQIVQRNEVNPLLNGDIKRWVERPRMSPILASIFYAIC